MNVQRLTKIYQTTTPEQRRDGRRWYPQAHRALKRLAATYAVSVEQTCAVCSILSPAVPWEDNLWFTEALLAQGRRHPLPNKPNKPYRGYPRNWEKAARVASSTLTPDAALNERTSAKTFNFYHNLLRPRDTNYVTIDRHAYNVLMGKAAGGVTLTAKRYRDIAALYKEAAAHVGVSAPEFQATLWIWQRGQKSLS